MTKQYLMPASRITTGTAVPTSAGTAGDLYVRNTDPYPSGYIRIGTPAELVAFAARVNAGESTLNACLTADLDMTGVSYTSIGTSSNPYAGTFMGYGKIISNLTISSGSNQGLFGRTVGATITGVGCYGFTISCSGGYRVGSFIGSTGSGTSISNCYSRNCTVSGCSGVGGFAGGIYEGAAVENSYSYNCTVTATDKSSPAAGFVGFISGSTSNCATHGGNASNRFYGSFNSTYSVVNCYYSNTTVTEAVFKTRGFWDGTGVSGTTYLSWDFDDTWEWDSTNSLPKLTTVTGDTSLYAYNGSSWALQNTVLDATPTSASANGVTSGGVYAALSGKQETAVVSTGTLTVAGWSSKTQTISVSGVTASNTVIVSPSSASFSDYGDAKIYCSAQGAGTLTFTCDTVPASAVTVNVVIL